MIKKENNHRSLGPIYLFAILFLVTVAYINFFKYQVYLQFRSNASEAAERFEIYINSDVIRPYTLPIQNKILYEVNLGNVIPKHIKINWLGLSGNTIKIDQLKLVVKKGNQLCDIITEIDLKKPGSILLENAYITQNNLIKNSGNGASLSFGINLEKQTALEKQINQSDLILKNFYLANFVAFCLLLFFCAKKYADQIVNKKIKILKNKNVLFYLLILLLIVLPVRFSALNWEIPRKENSLMGSLDEVAIVNAVLSINWPTGNIVSFGYREGSFMYYIWAMSIDFAHSLGFLKTDRNDIKLLSEEYGECVLIMRCVNAIFATGTSVLIFLLCLRWKIRPFYSFLSSLSYLAIPIILLWDTLARTHGPANFFLLLIFYCSTYEIKKQSNIKYIFLGLLCGICTSVRYTMIFSLIIPILNLLKHFRKEKSMTGFKKIEGLFFIFISFTTAFIFTQPGFVFNYPSVKYLLNLQSQYIPNNLGNRFFEITGIENVFYNIFQQVPLACTEALSLIFFLSFVMTCLTRSIKKVIPFLIFCVFYLFFVSKYYPFGFLRTLYPLFAFFPFLIGLVLQDIHRLSRFRRCLCSLSALLVCICLQNSISIKLNLREKTARTQIIDIIKQMNVSNAKPVLFFFEVNNSWDSFFPIIQATHSSIHGIWIKDSFFSNNTIPAVNVFFTRTELEKIKKSYDHFELSIIYSAGNHFFYKLEKIPWEYSLFFPNFVLIKNKV